MKTINADSFSGRLVLNAFDKLVFTLLLFLIFAYWTNYQREIERSNIRLQKVHDIEIDRPMALVEQLSKPIVQCLHFIELNKVGVLDRDEARELQSLLVEIKLYAAIIQNYAREGGRQRTSEASAKLAELVRDFGIDASRGADLDRYNQFSKQLEDQYRLLFSSTVEETAAMIGNQLGREAW